QFARKCSICHTLKKDGAHRAGPTLFGVFGRRAGTLPGYSYSKALKNSSIVWSERTIGRLFEEGPEHFTPGSKMPLQKIADAKVRGALVEFLKKATTEPGSDEAAQAGGAAGTGERQGEK
ncbi:MAG: c-type cytochrome, partial [Methyloligellaceae bacterium]